MFHIPNEASATYARQSTVYDTEVDAIIAAMNGTGIKNGTTGCAVTAHGGTMTVDVASGTITVSGADSSITSKTSGTMTTHATLDKWYLVELTTSNTCVVTAGTAASSPVMPSISSASNVLVAAVYLPAATTAI